MEMNVQSREDRRKVRRIGRKVGNLVAVMLGVLDVLPSYHVHDAK